MNQKEVWKDIKKYKGSYQVSNIGRVKSLKYGKSRILKLEEVNRYLRVSLCCNNKINRFLVHRLVSYHFIPNNENKPCVNHKDGDKFNNNVNNLRWSSRKMQTNNQKPFRDCKKKTITGEKYIHFEKRAKKKQYFLQMHNKHINNGKRIQKYFYTIEEAVVFRDKLINDATTQRNI